LRKIRAPNWKLSVVERALFAYLFRRICQPLL
jgi:hypothetical protein